MDPLISLLKRQRDVVEFIARGFKILSHIIKTPDVGKRRQELFIITLKKKFSNVEEAGELEREVDFYLIVDDKKKPYSLKTVSNLSQLKVAWNGFPSKERIDKFQFTCPIVYIEEKEGLFVFELEDIESVKRELGFENFWWIPKSNTNPRGFGISRKAVKRLKEIAKSKDNYIHFPSINEKIDRGDFMEAFYEMMEKLVNKLKNRKHSL